MNEKTWTSLIFGLKMELDQLFHRQYMSAKLLEGNPPAGPHTMS